MKPSTPMGERVPRERRAPRVVLADGAKYKGRIDMDVGRRGE